MSEIAVASSEGSLDVTYDGVADSSFRVQATFTGSGELLDGFDMPASAEIIAANGEFWLREPGEAWAAVESASGERQTAMVLLNFLATPTFYLHIYGFEDLELSASGTETIGGVEAARVRLEREDIVRLISGLSTITVPDGQEVEISGDDRTDIENDALGGLPEDFVVETWIGKQNGYPVRISVTFTVPEGDEALLVREFPGGSKISLQMDITDTDVIVDIEPPTVD